MLAHGSFAGFRPAAFAAPFLLELLSSPDRYWLDGLDIPNNGRERELDTAAPMLIFGESPGTTCAWALPTHRAIVQVATMRRSMVTSSVLAQADTDTSII
jgi:hypothetical protein